MATPSRVQSSGLIAAQQACLNLGLRAFRGRAASSRMLSEFDKISTNSAALRSQISGSISERRWGELAISTTSCRQSAIAGRGGDVASASMTSWYLN
eukprot:CAMPEP_0206631872 /NCGR_PEP_ID=MMETSP0325_2-20121206/68538_1 /ASSEMBLY_ACC=CAM_ASM_000347 /TAXON_ID=2866 /ORGANISM="Crypthecodinium cohnii, Strain Seligo" /LENGTH=96 /DNA_ID=CAMNT_0054157227 /DNA_START=59 /DNA_END=349 /DNA_ORIENTATION=+